MAYSLEREERFLGCRGRPGRTRTVLQGGVLLPLRSNGGGAWSGSGKEV